MFELAFLLVAGGLGQGQPELDSVEGRRVLGRDLRVADAPAGGHEVDLAGQDQSSVAARVDVLDGAGEEPTDRLQSGVRVRGDVHAAGGRHVLGAVVVDEAPGADEGALTLRQGAAHLHRPGPAEGDVAGGDDLHRGASLLVTGRSGQSAGSAHHLGRIGFDVAHLSLLSSLGGSGRRPR